MERMRADNTGPVWFKAGDAINSPCLYEVADLDRWVMEQKGKVVSRERLMERMSSICETVRLLGTYTK